MIKLLVLDLDGTLYNSKAEVDETNRLAILAAEKRMYELLWQVDDLIMV